MTRSTLGTAASLLAITFLVGAADPPPTAPIDIDQAIRALGHSRYAVREQASKQLWRAGEKAEPALLQAARASDPEVARRASDLLDKFSLGIYPTTPPEAVAAIEQFRGGNVQAKQRAVTELVNRGRDGYNILKRLLPREDDPVVRQTVYHHFVQVSRGAVPRLFLHNELDTAEELLETTLAGQTLDAASNYATFQRQRGTLPAAIARFERQQKLSAAGDPRAAFVLLHLYRAKGDWPAALKAAQATEQHELVDAVRWEAQDWAGLADLPSRPNRRFSIDVGLQAAYHRLSGNAAAFAKDVQALKQFAEANSDDRDEVRYVAEVLFINEQVADALKLLQDHRKNLGLVLQVLILQARYAEAVTFAEQQLKAGIPDEIERRELNLQYARLLYLLGHKDAALKRLNEIQDSIRASYDLVALTALVKVETRMGLRDLAALHAAQRLDKTAQEEGDHGVREVFQALYNREQAGALAFWWRYLRQRWQTDPPEQVMARVRQLVQRPAPAEALAWVEQAAADLTANRIDLRRSSNTTLSAWHTIAEVYQHAQQTDKERQALEKAVEVSNSTDALLRLGDYWLRQQKPKLAVEQFTQACQRYPDSPVPLYLRGLALTQAGDVTEGRKNIEAAHWLPLGNEVERVTFAEELSKRGYPDGARQERALALATSWYRSWQTGNLLNAAARDALTRKDYLTAAQLYQRAALGCLRTGAVFAEPTAYLTVPQSVRQFRARGWVRTGQVEAALREAEACLQALPGNLDLVIGLVPELDRTGHKPHANELYQRVRKVYLDLLPQHPQSGWLRNAVAWLGANCQRDLDAALQYATEATTLEPHSVGYLDTLAEVHFRRGAKSQALEIMRKCIAQEPHNEYYRKQLARFEKGDPGLDMPDEEE
jgi:hypothetical protein